MTESAGCCWRALTRNGIEKEKKKVLKLIQNARPGITLNLKIEFPKLLKDKEIVSAVKKKNIKLKIN